VADRPHVLLVPDLTELEWGIKPELEEWAEVASFDCPGVGTEPPAADFGLEAIVQRALLELDRLGWDRYVLVGDGYSNAAVAEVASQRQTAVRGVALGHACLSLKSRGDRPARTPEMFPVLLQLARTDYAAFTRALTQITTGSFDEERADRLTERVPREIAVRYLESAEAMFEDVDLEPSLRQTGSPLMLVEHRGCIQWTKEGFEDALAAFPNADVARVDDKPSVSPEFAAALQSFCERLPE
jgi:pimeloyl-ACP methyl ester carboxylesterase